MTHQGSNYRINLNPHHVSIDKLNDGFENGGLILKQYNYMRTDGFSPNFLVWHNMQMGINFWIYIQMSSRFRDHVRLLVCLLVYYSISEQLYRSYKEDTVVFMWPGKLTVYKWSDIKGDLVGESELLWRLLIKRRLCKIKFRQMKPSHASYRASSWTIFKEGTQTLGKVFCHWSSGFEYTPLPSSFSFPNQNLLDNMPRYN